MLSNVCPRPFSPLRSSSSVDSGPGSTIAELPPDSSKSAAIDRGRPVQFRSMEVNVVMLPESLPIFSRASTPSGNPVEARICLRNLGGLTYAIGTALCLFLMMSLPENIPGRGGVAQGLALRKQDKDRAAQPHSARSLSTGGCGNERTCQNEFREDVYA